MQSYVYDAINTFLTSFTSGTKENRFLNQNMQHKNLDFDWELEDRAKFSTEP